MGAASRGNASTQNHASSGSKGRRGGLGSSGDGYAGPGAVLRIISGIRSAGDRDPARLTGVGAVSGSPRDRHRAPVGGAGLITGSDVHGAGGVAASPVVVTGRDVDVAVDPGGNGRGPKIDIAHEVARRPGAAL